MKQKTFLLLGIFLLVAAIAGTAGFFYLGNQAREKDSAKTITPTPGPQTNVTITTSVTEVPDNTPAGWLTYTNTEHGFEISYPPSYEALDDTENLYGWPDAVVLFYGGGQSYDLPVEAWESENDYQTKYPNAQNLTVHQIGNKYVTLVNVNFEPEVDQIIATFTLSS